MNVQPHSATREFTVLILGMTGVGKSTFVNSIANYLSFETLDEAITRSPYCIIPTKFSLTIKGDRSGFTELNIEMLGMNADDSTNEVLDIGQSATQAPRSYSFVQNNVKINIIDVPGIGDTAGQKKDKENRAAIIEKISKFPEIHSVWIMLKATESRSTLEFLYSLNDIFAVIPRSAVENISFIITYSKSSDFTPGLSSGPLKRFIENLNTKSKLNIDINDVIFCVDSESFRFQVAYFTNEIFKNYVDSTLTPETRAQRYDNCWIESRKATLELLKRTLTAEPQSVSSFLAINRARILVPCFLNAAVKVVHLIEKSTSSTFQKELMAKLMTGIDMKNDINVDKKNKPQTVCTNKKCISWRTKPDGSKVFEFTQICHDN